MTINISGKNMQVGEALSGRIMDQITGLLDKYFSGRGVADVVLIKESSRFICDIKIHLPNRVMLQSSSQSHADPTSVYLEGEEKIAKQLRRYKRRLNSITREDTGSEVADVSAIESTTEYVIKPLTEDAAEDDDLPLIIAEESLAIQKMTVSDAVMRLDLGNLNYLLFRNGGNKRLNMVYRRADGHFGWLDPEQ